MIFYDFAVLSTILVETVYGAFKYYISTLRGLGGLNSFSDNIAADHIS